MTVNWGVVDTGFLLKTTDEFIQEIQEAFITKHGAINFNENSNLNHMITIFGNKCGELAEVLQGVYNAPIGDLSSNTTLDNAFALVNVSRLEPLKSTATVTLETTGASPVTIPAGSIVKQSSNNTLWETVEEVEIPANSTIDVGVTSQEYGAFSSPIASIDTIVTTIAGWNSVTNAAEGQLGRGEEEDPDYRLRKETAVVISKGGLLNAVISRILSEVAGVTYCTGLENNTDTTDGNGLLPHSIKITVVGGSDTDIANMILRTKGNGINTNGTESVTGTDEIGNTETVKFSRATVIEVYITVNLTTNANYDSASDDVIKDLIFAYGETLEASEDVLRWAIATQINPEILGIENVDVRLGTSPSPTGTSNISIAQDERARILLSNIVVNS
jgi:uncharacterized phage protein gp47/JayE